MCVCARLLRPQYKFLLHDIILAQLARARDELLEQREASEHRESGMSYVSTLPVTRQVCVLIPLYVSAYTNQLCVSEKSSKESYVSIGVFVLHG